MVRRTSAVRRRGLTAYKLCELLTGTIMYPVRYYDGYGDALRDPGGDDVAENYISDAMRQDWEATARRSWPSGAAANSRRPTILQCSASTSACCRGCSCAGHPKRYPGQRSSSIENLDAMSKIPAHDGLAGLAVGAGAAAGS
jgi:hypothetical protein